jgi:RNA 3'-terminal phosphate cyclase (ATP)
MQTATEGLQWCQRLAWLPISNTVPKKPIAIFFILLQSLIIIYLSIENNRGKYQQSPFFLFFCENVIMRIEWRHEVIEIDGAFGEGGGQILRSALSLSLVTQQPFRITNIRANRQKPGLLKQHLTAVYAALEISKAKVEGAELGSMALEFWPGTVQPGSYHFNIGSAGSCSLVFQTVFPALMMISGQSRLMLEGGTHNPLAPSYDYLQQVFVPILRKMGVTVKLELIRYGFYPAGGGQFTAVIDPVHTLNPIELIHRGNLLEQHARCVSANISPAIAHKEAEIIARQLGWPQNDCLAHHVPSPGPGNVVMVALRYEALTEMFTAFGKKGLPLKQVAKAAADFTSEYLRQDMPVGEYLADQLIIPMALAGKGRFFTITTSLHTQTNIQVIQKFFDIDISIRQLAANQFEVKIDS